MYKQKTKSYIKNAMSSWLKIPPNTFCLDLNITGNPHRRPRFLVNEFYDTAIISNLGFLYFDHYLFLSFDSCFFPGFFQFSPKSAVKNTGR